MNYSTKWIINNWNILPKEWSVILVTGDIKRWILTYTKKVWIPNFCTHWTYYPDLPIK